MTKESDEKHFMLTDNQDGLGQGRSPIPGLTDKQYREAVRDSERAATQEAVDDQKRRELAKKAFRGR